MRQNLPSLLKSFLFFAVIFILEGCTKEPGIWKNDKIVAEVRADFNTRNQHFIDYVKLNQIRKVNWLLSRELNSYKGIEPLVDRLSNRFNDNKYQLVDEYYIVNSHFTSTDSAKITETGINGHSLVFTQPAKEMYVCLFLPTNGENKYLITVIYSKLDYGWRITDLQEEPYTMNGETCPELFNQAKAAFNKGYLIDAINTAALASGCSHPAEQWRYSVQDSLTDFYNRVLALANAKYTFPYVLNSIATKPRLIRVFNQTDERGSFPMIHYLTSIKLANEAAIRRENMQIRQVIGQVMPGIDKDKKYVLYSAFNEKPSNLREVERTEMTDTLKLR